MVAYDEYEYANAVGAPTRRGPLNSAVLHTALIKGQDAVQAMICGPIARSLVMNTSTVANRAPVLVPCSIQ